MITLTHIDGERMYVAAHHVVAINSEIVNKQRATVISLATAGGKYRVAVVRELPDDVCYLVECELRGVQP